MGCKTQTLLHPRLSSQDNHWQLQRSLVNRCQGTQIVYTDTQSTDLEIVGLLHRCSVESSRRLQALQNLRYQEHPENTDWRQLFGPRPEKHFYQGHRLTIGCYVCEQPATDSKALFVAAPERPKLCSDSPKHIGLG